MGCDIHLNIEKRVGSEWQKIPLPDDYDHGWRDYRHFAVIANVRNGVHGYVTPIAGPRGVPDDAHAGFQEWYEGWGNDAHSASWLTLRELYEHDWSEYHAGGPMYAHDPYLVRWCKQHWPDANDDIRLVFFFDN